MALVFWIKKMGVSMQVIFIMGNARSEASISERMETSMMAILRMI